MIRVASWVLVLAAACGGRPAPFDSGGTRLINLLATASELPAVVAPRVLARVGPVLAPAGKRAWSLNVPAKWGRPLLARVRFAHPVHEGAAMVLYGVSEALPPGPKVTDVPPAGTKLGECLVASRAGNHIVCQRLAALGLEQPTLVVYIPDPSLGIEEVVVEEAQLPDPRRSDQPATAGLLRRERARSESEWSWRTSLIARDGDRYAFDVALPRSPALRVALGEEGGAESGPVRFVVKQDGKVRWNETVTPDSTWHELRIPLEPSRGATSRLELESFSADGGVARGLWAEPRLESALEAPNVLLITVDALRPDHLSAYGYARDTSPGLDVFAKAAVKFNRATSQAGRTWESVTSLLTGRYPAGARVRRRGEALPADVALLPELFAAAGYETLAAGDLALFPPNSFGGFDEEALSHTGEDARYSVQPRMKKWAAAMQRHPVFGWVHLENTHYPLHPDEPLRYHSGYAGRFAEGLTLEDHGATRKPGSVTAAEKAQIEALYDAAIRDADREITGILHALVDAGVAENTIVVITADHGELLGEHGVTLEHLLPYEHVLHVPLFIAWPGHLAPRAVSDRVELVDLAPTLLALTGVSSHVALDGRDLRPLLEGRPLPGRDAYSELAGKVFSLYRGDLHLLLNPSGDALLIPDSPVTVHKQELYDVKTDPAELHDLSLERPAELATMRSALQCRIELPGGGPAAIGQAAMDALRQAGYLNTPQEGR